MGSQLLVAFITTLLILFSIFIVRRQRAPQVTKESDQLGFVHGSSEPTLLSKTLASALPENVILPHNVAAYKQSMRAYWAQQECEVIPACVVQPREVQQLCTAVSIIKREYDKQRKQTSQGKVDGLFAIRSGGHSPVAGAASIEGGVIIDLRFFCEVTPSKDKSSVVIGAGAKWMDVSKALDEKGLAVVGGRNSAVGVGGLTLGGKLLRFSTTQVSAKSSTAPSCYS